ncbi:MAG: histidine--tRNA ligase [Planctomycetota bacterium]|nr:histidine--tRNA ligase [Planctomycetota bacterium]MDE1889351.1 histidine--tRNA ligase [Planctomycetota bacterium]MDE2215701.1 histidine--tRNA ligase [Planctomycetota bacterium]
MNVNTSAEKKTEYAFKAPRGTEDILPENWALWRRLEGIGRQEFELCGYYEIRTPIFEDTRLFVRSIGEATDIVEKEMYIFADSEDSSITLRPENTAPVMRAYLEYELYKTKKFQKFYYIGPQFRKERPQAGRLRQFHQMGIEAVGASDPLLDVETISVAARIFDRIDLKGYKVKINSIGCQKCRPVFRNILKEKLREHEKTLCDLCQSRLNRNVFRILDCKNEKCKTIGHQMPSISDYLCNECQSHAKTVRESLLEIGIPYIVDAHLVRGLDYYTKTVYEITHSSLGARDAICAGGRYDNLVSDIGGPSIGSVGFAIGMEATILALKNVMAKNKSTYQEFSGASPLVYIISIGEETKKQCFYLLNLLRKSNLSADYDYEGRSPKAQMRMANKLGVKYVIVLGPDELARGDVKIKAMETSEEISLKQNEVLNWFLNKQAHLKS